MTSRRFGRATASARARLWPPPPAPKRNPSSVALRCRETVTEADEMRRRTCVYCCAHMNVFSLFFPAQVLFTCSVLWFSHFQGLWPFCWCLLRVRLPILDSTVLEWLTLLSCCAYAIIFPFVLSLGLFSLSE